MIMLAFIFCSKAVIFMTPFYRFELGQWKPRLSLYSLDNSYRATEEDLSDLSERPKHVPIEGPDTSVFFLNDEEHQQLRYLFVLMILCLNEQLVCVVLVFLNIMLVLRMPWSGATRTNCQLCNKGILMGSI